MAYELTFVQGLPGRNYSGTSSPSTSGGNAVNTSNPLTLKFLDDDALLHEAGADATPATLLEAFSLNLRGTTYSYPAGTEVALSKPTLMRLQINGQPTLVNMQGLLVKDGTTWKPILPSNSANNPGLYIFTNAESASPDFGKPITVLGNFTAQNLVANRPAVHIAYDGEPDQPSSPECFTPGALIDTPQGSRRVEDLHPGDLVLTRDRGPQPILWVGRRQITADQTAAAPWLRPIRIRAGALAPGCPARDLVVSPQHRLLLRSRILARVTGAAEVLTPACQLLGWPGVEALRARHGVTYLHLMCARHEVIRADGAWTETLYPGPELRRAQSPMAREIALLFPALMAPGAPVPEPARPLLRGKPLREVRRRAAKNRRSLVEDRL